MLVTLYKKTISRLLIVTACLFLGQLVNAQQYPVQIVPQLLPPYTLNVSDYYNGTSEKLVLLLTNTDLNKPTLQVRLRMSILGQTAKLISRDAYYPPISLDGGVATRISLADLAPYFNADNLIFEGITRAQYVQSGKLPEGFYQFCFEAVEVNSGQVVGRSSCAMAWISLSDPPLLNLPRTAESIVYKDPQNIIFQWTPRNYNSPTSAFNTEYEFTLVEIWDNGLAPEAAFGTAQPLYRTTTQATTLLYGPGEPLLLSGHKYAWRVRAQQTNGSSGSDAWRNNGYSEIFWFNCQNNCAAPVNVQHELSGGRATITWSSDPNQSSFTVDYREKGQNGTTWYNSPTTANRMMLYDLKKDKTYEYRVGGTCDNGITYTYSDIKTLVMAGTDSAANASCGLLVAEPNIANRTPIQTLLTGDVITAGDFPVKLLQVSGQGNFTGAGYVTVPFLGQSRVKVRFTGITVNTDKQLIGGVIETTYDARESQIGNLDKVIDGGGGVGIVVRGVDTAGYYVDMVIPDAKNIDVDLTTKVDSAGNTVPAGGATLTVTGSDGTVKQVKVDELPATIKDKNGTVYGVDKDGKVSKIGSSEVMNMTAAELNTLQTDKAVVKFVPHEHQLYAFDKYEPVYNVSVQFRQEYEKLNDNYYVSSKAIVEAKSDVIKAVVEIKDKSIVVDSIIFVTGKGTRYESTLFADSTSWEIKIVGGPAADAQELYALYPQGGGKYLSLGKLLIASYPERTFKVVLVPVNGAPVNKDQISSQLDSIYKRVGITFQVTEDKPFNDMSWDLHQDGKLAVSGSGWLSNLTDEMKALNSAYKAARTIQQDAIYLFVLKGSDSTLAGDMPRGKQFGYLFTGADGKAAAHEIGHGLFNLKHSFDSEYGFKQGELPSNVMDYPNGDRFAKYQWNQLYKPGVVIGLFEKDGDGQLKITSTDAFKNLKNANTNTYTFLSPGGLPVTLLATATDIILSETNYFMTKEENNYLHTTPFGTLVSFTLKNGDQTEVYTAVGKTSERRFAQYQCTACNGGKGKPYVDILSAKETSGNVILAWPCFKVQEPSDELYYEVNACWFRPGTAVWDKTKVQNYGAGGLFSDAEQLLGTVATTRSPYYYNDNTISYTISEKASTFSDFADSKAACTFIADNTSCDRMPFPDVMNIANLIKLNEAGFTAFVAYKNRDKESTDNTTTKYGMWLQEAVDYYKFLTEFQDYLKIFKQQSAQPQLGLHELRLDTIINGDVMEYTLGKVSQEEYSSLTAAERIQILKVLTPGGSSEAQLIKVISTIPDKNQAKQVADSLNANQKVLLRLIRDVDDGTNHDDMMAALFDMCRKKDDHGEQLTADDLVGYRLHYEGKFDYGAFTITSTINRVDFGEDGGIVKFSIAQKKAQVFSSNTPTEIKQKYEINFNGTNGYFWTNIKPLDFVTVVFGEDFTITDGGTVFNKGDIVRIPALYLWNLYDIDAKQTAKRVRASAVKFAIAGATLIGTGLATGAAEKLLATLDFASSAYIAIVSPGLIRTNLSPGTKAVVEAFDNIANAYMLLRSGEGGLQMGQLFKNYADDYLVTIRALKNSASESELNVLNKLEDVAESASSEGSTVVSSGQAGTDPASSSGGRPRPTQGQAPPQTQTGTQGRPGTPSQPATPAQGPPTTPTQTGTQAETGTQGPRTGSDNQPPTQNTSTSNEPLSGESPNSGRPLSGGGAAGEVGSEAWIKYFTSKLKNQDLAAALKHDLTSNAAFRQLIEGNEELVEAWEVLETAGYSALRTDANELEKVSKIIKDNHLTLDAAVDAVRSAAARVIPAPLVAKITQNGASRLSNWFTGKALRFKEATGTVLTGAQAETRILEKLNATIGDKAVIEVVEDTHGRFLVRTEGGTMSDRVVSVEINVNGDYDVYPYIRAYKPSARPSLTVDLSVNKLAPDYTTQGGIYLCPQNVMTNGQRNVVEIVLTGNMDDDFEAANVAAGFSSWGDKAPKLNDVQYTWHHMDDFNPATGRGTLQLVRQDAHTKIPGIAHSGGAAQYRAYYGRGYGK